MAVSETMAHVAWPKLWYTWLAHYPLGHRAIEKINTY